MAAHRKSLMKGARLTLAVNELIQAGKIEDTKIPFACAATDLKYGESIVFKEGDIRFALTASAAIPGFIPPLEKNGRVLVDGSVCNNFPIQAAQNLGANFVIASNVSLLLDDEIDLNNVIDIVIRSNTVSMHQINQLLLKDVDYIISPETGYVHWSEFEKYDELVEMGVKAAENKIDELKELIKMKNSLWGRTKFTLKHKLEKWLN